MQQVVADSSIPQQCFAKKSATAIMQCLQSISSVTAPIYCTIRLPMVNVTLATAMTVRHTFQQA
jgi:hypothetical protein